jgi:hypothetical protein
MFTWSVLDTSSDLSVIRAINKDTVIPIYSPHFGLQRVYESLMSTT